MTSSIEYGCAVLMSRYDKEDICSCIIYFWVWVYSRTCLITSDELLLSSAMMVEIFCPSQNRDLRGVVAVLVSEVNFERLTPKNIVAIL